MTGVKRRLRTAVQVAGSPGRRDAGLAGDRLTASGLAQCPTDYAA